MKNEKTNQNNEQVSNNENVQPSLTEYRIYEHPLLPKRIVKIGFCWPALIIGPAYLIYKRLWISLVVCVVAIFLARYLVIQIVISCDNCSYISPEDQSTMDNIFGCVMFVGLVLLGYLANSLWEKDLINRGYLLTKSLQARSMDDALAAIEREKLSQ